MTTTTAVLPTIESVMSDYTRWVESGMTGPVPHFHDVPRRRRTAGAKKAPARVAAPKLSVPKNAYTLPNGSVYIPRLWGEHADVAVLQQVRERAWDLTADGGPKEFFVLMTGEPGTGKTVLPLAAYGEDLEYMQLSGETEVADFYGQWVERADGSVAWQDGKLVVAMEQGKVLFLDEIMQADPKALIPVYGAMDGQRRISIPANPDRGVIEAKPGFFIIAASNPNAPGARASEALLSRFRIHVEVGTDYPMARKLGVNSDIVTIAGNADRKRKNGSLLWAPQMRELITFRDNEALLGFDFAMSNLMQQCPEDERGQFSSLVERTLGKKHDPLEAGKQVPANFAAGGAVTEDDVEEVSTDDDE